MFPDLDDWDDEELDNIDGKYLNMLDEYDCCDDDDDEEEYVDGLWNGLTTARISDTLILGADKETTNTPRTRLDAPLDVICPYQTQLIEVDGRLAVLALKIRYLNPGSTYWSKNHNPSMKMCIFHDGGQDTISTSIQGSRSFNSYYWTEDTFSMPPFAWKPERLDTVLPIQGTDLFLIKPKEDQFSFYYYNWKKKFFSSSKLEIEGISSFLRNPTNIRRHSLSFMLSPKQFYP
ncbi:hypothetical protein MKX03_006417 [Papaver bracteatum]|nr:hypothetical protein MKX03_006417 [Papaver bracteatum]